MDITAIGNAKIAGIEKDLNMSGFEFNIALTVFYYIVVDVPSNLALKRFGSPWLAALITSFGLISIATAFIHSYSGLILTRVFLGLAEGVGGLLASGLLSVPDFHSVKSWRKIFLIEGIITTGFGLLCFFILPTDPLSARFLNDQERLLAMARIDGQQTIKTQGRRERTTLKLVFRSLSAHVRTILATIVYIMLNISFQGLSLFMPTVVATLGNYTVVESQLRTVPPYAVAAVWSVLISYLSYRMRHRSAIIFVCGMLMISGYAISVGTRNSHARWVLQPLEGYITNTLTRYAACFLTLAGASPGGPLVLAWAADNAAPDTVKAVTTAIVPGMCLLVEILQDSAIDLP
ncbi:hypothetical protein H0H93_010387 [Arthromyces matolae]|nr:hypothetical protein H0H93_010387 [Arthromyces matolae]